ncbi:MAG: sigma-70 family RNA polymerase sigma factor [Alphaproteobacteria bacterium]|nr:sigma-70 family RNA polymerase sigma factor [Alphaproteobacteria bacterium]
MRNALVRRASTALQADPDTRRWLSFVRDIPRITDHRAAELARAFRAGDAHAGEQLVAAHLYVVLQVAMRLRVRADSAFDLIQEGNAGLLDALHRFEPDRGVPFSAYSRYWARARMLAFLSTHSRLVQPGRPTRRRVAALLSEVERREARGEVVDDEALAGALEIQPDQVRRIRDAMAYGESVLDAPEEEGGRALSDRLAAPLADPEEQAVSRQLASRVADAVVSFADTLDKERDQVLFFERIASDEPTSLADLGRRFGVSRERARQIEARILPRFREHLRQAVGFDAVA